MVSIIPHSWLFCGEYMSYYYMWNRLKRRYLIRKCKVSSSPCHLPVWLPVTLKTVTTSMCLARVDLASVAVSLTWPSNGVDNYMVGVLPTVGKRNACKHFLARGHVTKQSSQYHEQCVWWGEIKRLFISTECCPFGEGKNRSAASISNPVSRNSWGSSFCSLFYQICAPEAVCSGLRVGVRAFMG